MAANPSTAPWWFRFRVAVLLVLFVLAFSAPWDFWLHLDGPGHGLSGRNHTWEVIAAPLGATMMAFNGLLVVAILCATAGAALRVWAAAYLGSGVVHSNALHGAEVVADGPYRHVRNPLYIGLFLNTLALALIMPPSGAVFAIVTVGLYSLCLIAAEERFLGAELGDTYHRYRSRVPRLLYSVAPRVIGSHGTANAVHPRWTQAILSEINMIGVAVGFAVFGWRYDNDLLLKVVIISLGVWIVVRALLPRRAA